MKSKEMTVFDINSEEYQFDSFCFNQYVDHKAKNEKIRKGDIENILAQKISVSSSAIHNWRFGCNGPSGIELIKDVAEYFNIDYMKLLKTKEEIKEMEKLSVLQIESLKRIFDAIIDFLDDFDKTDGFTGTLWSEFYRQGINDIEEAIYLYAEEQHGKVKNVFLKEYFYLKITSVYQEIENYIDVDLFDVFDGKLEYAYRHDAPIEGNPRTEDDYIKSLNGIKNIIDKQL